MKEDIYIVADTQKHRIYQWAANARRDWEGQEQRATLPKSKVRSTKYMTLLTRGLSGGSLGEVRV